MRRVFGLRERIYVCPKCGGPLEIECNAAEGVPVPALRAHGSAGRLAEPRDRSGVWRIRELLPFENVRPCVTLCEGNTPLYEAPRSRGILRSASNRCG